MRQNKRQTQLLRVTALTAALVGVYGVAAAQTTNVPPVCKTDCGEKADQHYYGQSSTPTYYDWIVKAEGTNAKLTLIRGTVKGEGHKTRGVGSTAGSSVILNGVSVTTKTLAAGEWGSHGIQAEESGSTLTMIGGSINASGEYSNGIQAGNHGKVFASGVTITADGGTKHTFGAEANNGGHITLTGGSVTVQGKNAGGVRAYTGKGKAAKGVISLEGTDVTVSGESAIGLMAGDKDGADPSSPGNVTFKNAKVVAAGKNAIAARAQSGGVLDIENATLTATTTSGGAIGVFVDGAGSELKARNLTIRSSGTTSAKGVVAETGGKITIDGGTIETMGGMNSHAMDSYLAGSSITANNVIVKTTGYAAGAFNGGEVVLNDGVFDVVGTTATEGWDTAAGFVAGGSAANSKLTANNVTLLNSVPLVNAPPAYTSYALRVGADFGTPLASNARMVLNDSEVIASGVQRRVAYIQNSSHLTVAGSHLVSEQDAGMFLADNASLTLNGSALEAAAESLRSQFSTSGSIQTITIGEGSSLVKNNGTLLRVDRSAGGADGIVNMTLHSGSHASGNIRNYDADGNLVANNPALTHFVVQPGALWAGIFIDDKTSVIDGSSNENNYSAGSDVAIEGGGAHSFTGTTNVGGSMSLGAGQSATFSGPTTIGSNLSGQDNSSTSVAGPANIGGSIVGGAGAGFTFGSSAVIGGDVGGAPGSSFAFNGPANISGGAQSDGASMTFAGGANIGQGVSGSGGSSFQFSTTHASSIGGNVGLSDGSSISGGSVNNPIEIGGSVSASGGSVLGGNLHVAGALSGTGGALRPGNSIGVQSYGGSSEFSGTYAAEVNAAGDSDRIVIRQGNFDLTGIGLTVGQENGNGGYRLNHDYTIVETVKADGISAVANNTFASTGLDGSFAGTLVRLDPVKYGANNVKVSLSVDRGAIDRTGYSANQNATLDGALSVVGGNASADAVMLMQPEARKDALNQLSGELHGSTQAALLQSSSLVSRTLSQRLRGNLGAGMLPGAPLAQAGGAVPAGAMPTSGAHPLWAQVVGNWGSLDDDGNAAKVKTNTVGLFVGGDAQVGAGWRLGGALGYTDGRIKVDDRNSKSDVSTFTAALYGGNSWAQGSGRLNFLAGAAYSHHDIDSRRQVNVGGNQTLKADYRAHTTQVFTELGYALPVGARSVVEPYAGLAWLGQKARGFTEEGGSAALQGDSQKDSVSTFTLGLRGKTALDMGAGQAQVFAGLGWRHASGDVDPGRRVSFVQGGGASFHVAGAPIAKNAALLDLGVEMTVGRNTAMGLGYAGQYGKDATDHSGQLYLRTRF